MGDRHSHDRDRTGGGHGSDRRGRRAQFLLLGYRSRRRRLSLDFAGRLVLAQTLESGLTNLPVAGEAGIFDLGDEFGAHPVYVGRLTRRTLSFERALVGFERPQLGEERLDLVAAKSRA